MLHQFLLPALFLLQGDGLLDQVFPKWFEFGIDVVAIRLEAVDFGFIDWRSGFEPGKEKGLDSILSISLDLFKEAFKLLIVLFGEPAFMKGNRWGKGFSPCGEKCLKLVQLFIHFGNAHRILNYEHIFKYIFIKEVTWKIKFSAKRSENL